MHVVLGGAAGVSPLRSVPGLESRNGLRVMLEPVLGLAKVRPGQWLRLRSGDGKLLQLPQNAAAVTRPFVPGTR